MQAANEHLPRIEIKFCYCQLIQLISIETDREESIKCGNKKKRLTTVQLRHKPDSRV